MTDQLDDKGHDVIRTLIPHEYVEGKNHGKQEKGGFLWDMQCEAGGLEKQLDELMHRWYQYMQERWLEPSKIFTRDHPAVFMADVNQQDELHRNFIFNNIVFDAIRQLMVPPKPGKKSRIGFVWDNDE